MEGGGSEVEGERREEEGGGRSDILDEEQLYR